MNKTTKRNLFVVVFRTEEDDRKGFKVMHKVGGSITERVVKEDGKEKVLTFIDEKHLKELRRHKDIMFDVL